MTRYRRWFCTCTGTPVELDYDRTLEENGEPYCDHCGAMPSSDPKKTLQLKEEERWDD